MIKIPSLSNNNSTYITIFYIIYDPITTLVY
nr:MAG TPA: hypothetical protein [Caudoviricetes sp.]